MPNRLDALKIDQRPTTLKEVALERVRDAIIEGAFEPGERLVERQLCERLGVSRSVVREVIRHLESEGLVETLSNRGPRVCRLNRATALEIYEIRALLEPAAADACARLATPGTVALLESALERLQRAHKAQDSLAALAATTRFYEIIFTIGRKKVAWEMVQRLNGRISRLRAMTLASQDRHASGMKRLRQIQTAIGEQDPQRAAEACRRHVAEAAEIAAGLIVD